MPYIAAYNLSYSGDMCIYILRLQLEKKEQQKKANYLEILTLDSLPSLPILITVIL